MTFAPTAVFLMSDSNFGIITGFDSGRDLRIGQVGACSTL